MTVLCAAGIGCSAYLLLRKVWGPGYESDTQLLRVHVAHIRAKLEDDAGAPALVVTEPGVGYRLNDAARS